MSDLQPVDRQQSIAVPVLRSDLEIRRAVIRRKAKSFLIPFVFGVLIGGFSVGWLTGRVIRKDGVPLSNRLPEGWVDEIGSNGVVTGWARDLDSLSQPVMIRVYFNGPEGVGTDSMQIIADQFRPDWNAWAFKFPIPPAKRNGIRHSVQVYAVDVNSSSGALTARLGVRDVTLKPVN